MTTITMTLEEKVRALVFDPTDGGPDYAVRELPHGLPDGAWLTEFEANLETWGMIYGIAVGLARTEEPCEPIDSVAKRALEAARPVFEEYGHGFKPVQRDQAIRDLWTRYVEYEERTLLTDPAHRLPAELRQAIERVSESRAT